MSQMLWQPSPKRINESNMHRFIQYVRETIDPALTTYSSLYQFSVDHPETFWLAIWEFCEVVGDRNASAVVDDVHQMPGARWFPEAKINFAENLLRPSGSKDAILFAGENGKRETLSFDDLRNQVASVAAALRAQGVTAGDRVAGYMPNCPQTIVAMLATASIGAIWSSCSPDFGVNGVVDRFGQIEPKVLFSVDGYQYGGKTFGLLPKIEEIAKKITSIERVVIVPFAAEAVQEGDIANRVGWQQLLADHPNAELKFERLAFDHPLYIMYSSGTTGVPKCIVHGHGGTLLQHLKELVLHTDVKPSDRVFYFTTCGWMMWNWLVSTLATGATVVLFDGNPFHPDAAALFDLVDEFDISIFGTSAKYIAAVEKSGLKPRDSHQLTSLKTILSTGSPLLPESFDFVYDHIKESVCLSSISGGTDIISCFALGNPVLPVYRSQLQCRGLGMAVQILNEDNEPVVGQTGELACVKAFPSMPVGFWNDPKGEKYQSAYFDRKPGVWCHGDYAELTPEGGVIIHGRSDATLNPGGVRIGTAEIYRQVDKQPEVLESIAVGQEWDGDVRVVLFVKMAEGQRLDDELRNEIKRTIRANTTPRHVPAKIIEVQDIPRTISGKITEIAVRDVIHGKAVKNTDALANPEALQHFDNLPELQTD